MTDCSFEVGIIPKIFQLPERLKLSAAVDSLYLCWKLLCWPTHNVWTFFFHQEHPIWCKTEGISARFPFLPLVFELPMVPCFTNAAMCGDIILLKKSEKGEEECVFQVPSWSAWEAFPEAGEDVLHLKWHTLYCRDIFPSKTRSWWQPSCVCQGSRYYLDTLVCLVSPPVSHSVGW